MACEASRSREPHTSLRSSATEPSDSRDLMSQRGSNGRSGKLRVEKTQSALAEDERVTGPWFSQRRGYPFLYSLHTSNLN